MFSLSTMSRAVRDLFETAENTWFDLTRNVHTAEHTLLRDAGVPADQLRDSEHYVPARPANIRASIRATGVADLSKYTFVDLGSGKGRSLMIATEFPFAACLGVELSEPLHRQACENLDRFRARRRPHVPVQSTQGNARTVSLPSGDLVLYLFNPFGPDTMQCVLDRVHEAMQAQPRHIVMILLWPRCADQVAQSPGVHQIAGTRRHAIFEWRSKPASSGGR